MADYESDLGRLESQLAGLEGTIAGLEGVTTAFKRELDGGAGQHEGCWARGDDDVALGFHVAAECVRGRSRRRQEHQQGAGQCRPRSLEQGAGPGVAAGSGAVSSAIGGGLKSLLSGILPFKDGGAFMGACSSLCPGRSCRWTDEFPDAGRGRLDG